MLKTLKILRLFSLMPENQFLKLAAQKMEKLASLAQQYEQKDIDINYSYNVLTVKANKNSIVINTQTPNRQLWYTCTLSGPQRYNMNKEQWINGQNREIQTVFQEDIKKLLKI